MLREMLDFEYNPSISLNPICILDLSNNTIGINMKAIIKNKSIESIEELQQEVQDLYKNEILVGFYPFDFLLEMANQIEEIAIEQNINFKELVKNAYMQVNNLSPEK